MLGYSVAEKINNDRQSRPLYSLLAVIVVVIVLTSVSFSVFWFSDTRSLVRTIQQTSNQHQTNFQSTAAGVNSDGVLEVSELLFIVEGIETETLRLNPAADFGGGDLQKTNLGF